VRGLRNHPKVFAGLGLNLKALHGLPGRHWLGGWSKRFQGP
jgi:hypothetical protein